MKYLAHAAPLLSLTLLAAGSGCSSENPSRPLTGAQTANQGDSSAAVTPDSGAAQTPVAQKAADSTKPKPETKIETTPEVSTPPPAAAIAYALSSTAFASMGAIPATYVAKNGGGNQSPPLQWKGAPAGTGSFAIQMVDLDFQTPPFIHWIITNIPATSTQLPSAIPAGNNLAAPAEAKGANQANGAYRGPNPPNLHRYEWTIYAIKPGETLNLGTNSATNKTELEAKSLGKTSLIGTYQ